MDEGCRILIVDDEFIMRQGIRHMMNWEEQGFQVVGEASNGKEALDLMETLKPHIVLCDIAMPVMDGLDFIRVAHRKYPDVQILILSGYDKFEYVRQALLNGAVDYVLKPTLNPGELSRILARIVQKIPGMQLKKKTFSSLENLLERYLNGFDQTLKAHEFAQYFPHSCYRLLGMPVQFRNPKGEDLSQVIFEKTEQYLKNHTPGAYLKFLQNHEFLCVSFNYPLKDEGRLMETVGELMSQLAVIHERAFAVLGPVRRNIQDLREDFANPMFLEAEAFYHKGVHLYLLKEEKNSEAVFRKFDFRRFSAAVADSNYGEAVEMFRDYIHKAVENRMPEFKLKNQTKNLLYNLVGSVESKAQELEQIRYEYFKKIDDAAYVEDFLKMLEDLAKELQECLGEGGENPDAKLKEMLDYISEYYKEDLDLANLAKTFNFNYSYLSSYFNNRMGEGFSEYLNRIRIGQACRLLEKEEMSISVISAMVGYSDQSYFCRVFKKITGETPSAYRRGRRTGKL